MGKRPAIRGLLKRRRSIIAVSTAAIVAAGAAVGATAANAGTGNPSLASQLASQFPGYHLPANPSSQQLAREKVLSDNSKTTTPIKHVVVLFDENESFDHYFGTYPYAANTDGTSFTAKPGTPTVKGLYTSVRNGQPTGPLLTDNANEYNPERLSPSEAWTSDQNHDYTPEQEAYDGGKQDKYVQYTESSSASGCGAEYCAPGVSMDYFDGNTVTGLWNYAQNYAMSDNNFDDVFGPSSPGALSVASGSTVGGYAADANDTSTSGAETADTSSVYNPNNGDTESTDGTIYSDVDPFYDECSDTNHTTTGPEGVSTGKNIGDLLNSKGVSWGWFQGGFTPTSTNTAGNGDTDQAVCGSQHSFTVTNSGGTGTETATDYVPHHNPFSFNATTANPAHLAPSSLKDIGYTDQANHNYGTSDFTDALNGTDGATLPAVSYIKPPAYENAHPGNSDPLEEQQFLVNEINSIEKSKYWSSTAIVVTYDDSDGWYDSATNPVINGSNTSLDTAACASVPDKVSDAQAACGLGDRLPMLVISPYTRDNYVSDNLTDTASVVRFIEDNWLGGERIPSSYDKVSGSLDAPGGLLDFSVKPHDTPVILNPTTGAVVSGDSWAGNQGKK